MNAPTSAGQLKPALHAPFSWLPTMLRGDDEAEFLARTKTVNMGVVTCMELVQQNELAHANGDAPTLSENDAHALMMLAAASAQMLADAAEERIDFLWAQANPLPR